MVSALTLLSLPLFFSFFILAGSSSTSSRDRQVHLVIDKYRYNQGEKSQGRMKLIKAQTPSLSLAFQALQDPFHKSSRQAALNMNMKMKMNVNKDRNRATKNMKFVCNFKSGLLQWLRISRSCFFNHNAILEIFLV